MDLLIGGLRERLGLHDRRGFAGGLALAAPVCLTLAAAYPVSYWVMGARSAVASGMAVVWILALALRVMVPRSSSIAVAAAVLSTVVAVVVGYYGPSTATLFIPSAAWGTLALLGILASEPADLTRRQRWGSPVAVVVAAAVTAWLDGFPGATLVWESTIAPPIWAGVVLPVVGVAALVGGFGLSLWRRDTRFAWAAFVVFVGLAPTLIRFSVWWRSDEVPSVVGFGRTNLVIFVMLGALTLLLVRGDRSNGDGRVALHSAGGVALGLCAASSAVVLAKVLADGGQHSAIGIAALGLTVIVAVLDRWLPVVAQRVAVALTLAALSVAATNQPSAMEPTFAMAAGVLLLVGLLTRRRGYRSWAAIWGMLGSAASIMLLVWIRYGESLPRLETQTWLIPILVNVVLASVAMCALVVVLRADRGWWRAVGAFGASLLWLVAALGPTRYRWAVGVTALVTTGLLAAARFIVRQIRRRAQPDSQAPPLPEIA